jgi:hypothetical protein
MELKTDMLSQFIRGGIASTCAKLSGPPIGATDDVVGPLVEGGWNIERTLAESRAEISAVSLFATHPRQKRDFDPN